MCKILNCNRPAVARGMCLSCYKRWRRRHPDQINDWQMPVADRFWSKVKKTSRCWLWTGATCSGYGSFMTGSRSDTTRKRVPAHRFAYELLVGPIPTGMVLDHKKQICGNRNCVNPKHLEPVTMRENILRGDGVTAINARKTHCPKGHPYTARNTIITKHGNRKCRTCRDAIYAKWKLKDIEAKREKLLL